MRIPEVLRVLGNATIRDNPAPYIAEAYAFIAAALNGNLQLGENLAVKFSGTFDVAANTTKTFGHTLQRKPVLFWAQWYDTTANLIAVAGRVPVIYSPIIAQGLWTASTISLNCDVATDATNLNFDCWVI